jgi:hypothetical protein
MAPVDDDKSSYRYFYVSTFDVVRDLVRATLNILDEDGLFNKALFPDNLSSVSRTPQLPPGPFSRFIRRFVIGLPVVGAASFVQMFLSVPFFGPVHWLARSRSSRDRRGNSRDIAAILIILFVVFGVLQQVPCSIMSMSLSLTHVHIGQYTECTS